MADTKVYVPVMVAYDKDGLLLLNDDKKMITRKPFSMCHCKRGF